ncbi:permease for cytosine/purines, uracil, thiamine, allantoin-domain-containing protein [Naematelia encephala]|uniref:Permease for cytosine/purines, uracil, thiamine, allantoin-domain-containing protein n=1 Tax=Naematelia encephala TaxID=71784 RepID=A0A1Y2BHN3_9TREE|nr:permease for cytosine/purines, uracil, thiamine, allantoin-domain-containing protein [Naematelia encephala]
MKRPSFPTATLRQRATSVAAWQLPKEDSCIAPEDVWSNKDMDPAPLEYRRWTSWTFFTCEISDLINPGTWATVASFVEIGLTWYEGILAIFLGGFLVSIVITANAYIGATIHTPFAVTARSVFGYWGSKFVVFSRMVIACFWLSINSWSGGVFVSLMIQAIWPQYARLPNSVPESQGATTKDFLSFFLFWLLQLPFVFIHPSRLAPMFNIKAVLVPIVALGTLIWAVKIAGSGASEALSTPVNRAAGGAPRFIAFMTAVTACQGTWATLSLNIGDFSRYCKSPRSVYIQLFAVPVLFSVLSIFAAISAACCLAVYGTALYQPYDMVAKWNTSAGGRCAMFLASLAWALANVTTNITANAISSANDMTSLAPRYINIKRGQIISVTIGVFGFAPWKVLNSAANFLTFMSSYSIVLAPIAALMAVDFFFVKKKKVDIYELYKPNGIYHFSKGWNWRSYIALAVAIAPNLPGMINAINSTVKIGNIKYIYMMSNITGDVFAVIVYLTLCKFFPAYDSLIDVPVHDIYDHDGQVIHDHGYPPIVEDYSKKDEDSYGHVVPVVQ